MRIWCPGSTLMPPGPPAPGPGLWPREPLAEPEGGWVRVPEAGPPGWPEEPWPGAGWAGAPGAPEGTLTETPPREVAPSWETRTRGGEGGRRRGAVRPEAAAHDSAPRLE